MLIGLRLIRNLARHQKVIYMILKLKNKGRRKKRYFTHDMLKV